METAAAVSRFEEATYRTLKRRLIPFLMLCYVVAYLDRINIGFAKLQMLDDLGFTETQYGLGAGAFFVGYILFAVPSNLAMQRVGAKIWIACIMVGWAVISGLMAVVTTASEFFVLRFLLGVAESGFYPGVILYLTHWFPNRHRGRSLSLFQSAVPIAGVFGSPLSGWILDHLHGQWHFRGWQWLFMLEALPAMIAGIGVLFYLDNSIAQARWLSPAQKDLLIRKIAQEDAPREPASVSKTVVDLRVWGLCVLLFGLAMGVYAIAFWMPSLLRESNNLSGTEVGWLSAIPNLIAIVAMFLVARSSDLRRERRWHVAVSAFFGGVGLAASGAFSHQWFVALVCLSVAAAGIMSALPLQWGILTAFCRGSGAAVAIALITSVGNLGGIVSPALIGWLKDKTLSLEPGMYVIAACLFVSAVIALSYTPRMVNR